MKAKVYQRKDREDRWYVQLYWKGKRHRRYHYDDEVLLVHYELAREIAERVNADIKDKGRGFDARQWFGVEQGRFESSRYIEDWLDRQTHYAPSYAGDVRRIVSRLSNWFRGSDLREIRLGHLEDFLASLPIHLAASTKKNILGVLRTVFSDAYRREDILRIPPFPRIRREEVELRWLDVDVVQKVFSHIHLPNRPIFDFGYHYALRPGELRALQWDCIRWGESVTIRRTFSGVVLKEQTKTNRIRVLPLTSISEQILRQVPRGISGYVFRTPHGKPYRKQRLQQLWHAARAETGIPAIPLYNAMRHSRAMEKLSEGMTIDKLQYFLGHTRIEMTQRYARHNAETIRADLETGAARGLHE